MSTDWISAPEAFKLVSAVLEPSRTPYAICSRAWAGLIQARAEKFVGSEGIFEDAPVPARFWLSHGGETMSQDWDIGDFDTWVSIPNGQTRWWAYGVSFSREGIELLIAPHLSLQSGNNGASRKLGGRPPAAWWDDLWIEMCRQIHVGDLKLTRQADIAAAMADWASARGHDPGDSTIKERARKLWYALHKEDGN